VRTLTAPDPPEAVGPEMAEALRGVSRLLVHPDTPLAFVLAAVEASGAQAVVLASDRAGRGGPEDALLLPGAARDDGHGTVLVTRPRADGPALADELRAVGLRPLPFPVLAVVPPSDPRALVEALAEVERYDWVVFTSRNAVRATLAAQRARGCPEGLEAVRLAAVGPGTAATLASAGLRPAFVAERHDAEGLLTELLAHLPPSARVLLPRAEAGRRVLEEGLARAGHRVTAVVAYRTQATGHPAAALVADALRRGEVGAATFLSPSAGQAFVGAVGEVATLAPAVAVGETTAAALRRLGFRRIETAEDTSPTGVARTALRVLSR
jgi:uroporphyrinogen-III synthase